MPRIIAAVGLSLLGIGTILGWDSPIGTTFGVVAIAVGVLVAFTATRTNLSGAWIRLDWFLPVLRKEKEGRPARSGGWTYRVAKRFLPKFLFSDRQTKTRGAARKWLRRLGVTWLSAPVRRTVQSVCLVAFLWLFFVTCWPYGAKPATPEVPSLDWQVVSANQDDGTVKFEQGFGAEEWRADLTSGHKIYGLPDGDAAVDDMPVDNVPVDNVPVDNMPVDNMPVDNMPVDNMVVLVIQQLTNRSITVTTVDPDVFETLITGQGSWILYTEAPLQWPSHYSANLSEREWLPADLFLVIDPLVAISTAVASRSWVWSLTCAGIILIVCVVIPRGFCGYLCPLGTIIELFDWGVSNRITRFRIGDEGWWVHIKYYLLAAILICAACGVLISGVFAAIPVVTRAMLFLFDPLQNGAARGWHLVPAINWGHAVSIVLFGAVLGIGLLRPRFWCKYVCPSGAVFSIGNLFRLTERKVESSCIHCNKCVEVCPFDAIKPDFTTRVTDCTECQTCAGVCPTHAIKFVERWNLVELKFENEPPTGETKIGRRGFLSAATGSAVAIAGGLGVAATVRGTQPALSAEQLPVRPPGSVPENAFLQLCIRCGECFKACPNNVLQPEGFQQGLAGLWAPQVNADWAGCESSCNNCGEVCPTGAIRDLPLFEKRHARMGLAIVDEKTCLPFAGKEACDLCVQECNAAGYNAIEYINVGTEADEFGAPIEGTGLLAPVVDGAKCVGCGLCQTRCYAINVKERHVLDESAIVIFAGEGREDRMFSGSYAELRQTEKQRGQVVPSNQGTQSPDEVEPADKVEPADDNNPFGL